MTEQGNMTPAELSADEIACVSGGNGVVGPSGGRSDEGGGTLGSGS
jgi:hypothetical protein